MQATPLQRRARRVLAVASLVWLETRRTRLPWIAVGLALALLAVSVFARSLALTESARLQLALLAPMVRMTTVVLVCLHVLGSTLREAQDGNTAYLLATDLPRAEYLLGKALGHLGAAGLMAALLGLPLLLFAPPAGAVAWLVSLMLESSIVVAAALFCAITLRQLMLGAAFVMGLYLLARAMAAILLIAAASPFAGPGSTHELLSPALSAVALLLPGLDRFTQTAWLLGAMPDAAALLRVGLEAIAYVALLLAASMVDFHRRNF
jgi:hypothetical protein